MIDVPVATEVLEILESFPPFNSGVSCDYSNGGNHLILRPPIPEVEGDIARKIASHALPGFQEELEGMALSDMNPLMRLAVGGDGITMRHFPDYLKIHPSAVALLTSTDGKIVFLGNGLSSVPGVFGLMYGQGKRASPPIVVDIFEYGVLSQDLSNLRDRFISKGVPFPFDEELACANVLADQVASGQMNFVNYLVGSGNPPQELMNADIVINCHGPPLDSIEEQLGLLGPSSFFCYNSPIFGQVLPEGYKFVERKTEKVADGFSAVVQRC